jgi:hypothetical protein
VARWNGTEARRHIVTVDPRLLQIVVPFIDRNKFEYWSVAILVDEETDLAVPKRKVVSGENRFRRGTGSVIEMLSVLGRNHLCPRRITRHIQNGISSHLAATARSNTKDCCTYDEANQFPSPASGLLFPSRWLSLSSNGGAPFFCLLLS